MKILRSKFQSLVLVCMLLGLSGVASAAIDAYEFADVQSQERYRILVDELRCPQCLNTNLAGSDSMIAKGLRREIHRMIQEGKSDDEIRQFMYERYGDFILYRPRVNENTALLWFGPILLLMIGLWLLHRFIFSRDRERVSELTDTDQNKLREILKDPDNS